MTFICLPKYSPHSKNATTRSKGPLNWFLQAAPPFHCLNFWTPAAAPSSWPRPMEGARLHDLIAGASAPCASRSPGAYLSLQLPPAAKPYPPWPCGETVCVWSRGVAWHSIHCLILNFSNNLEKSAWE